MFYEVIGKILITFIIIIAWISILILLWCMCIYAWSETTTHSKLKKYLRWLIAALFYILILSWLWQLFFDIYNAL